MVKEGVCMFLVILLSGCAGSGVINQPPRISSPDNTANVTIHRAVSDGYIFSNLTFTIDGNPTYRFGATNDYTFSLDAGDYIFGYTQGLKKCSTNVYIQAGGFYVFNLAPDCLIELEQE
jgi:hypothetical protein